MMKHLWKFESNSKKAFRATDVALSGLLMWVASFMGWVISFKMQGWHDLFQVLQYASVLLMLWGFLMLHKSGRHKITCFYCEESFIPRKRKRQTCPRCGRPWKELKTPKKKEESG